MVSVRSAAIKSAFHYQYGANKTAPLCLTSRDLFLVKSLVRWQVMTTAQLVRYEAALNARMDREGSPQWDEVSVHRGAPQGALDVGGSAWQLVKVRRDRLSKMARIIPATFPASTGPLVQSFRLSPGPMVWVPTAFGASMCGLPGWVHHARFDMSRTDHAFAVCDIGTQIERHGWRVASPREITRKMFLNGTELGNIFSSTAHNRDEKTRDITPDLAVFNPAHNPPAPHFIAVEIADNSYRPTRTYSERIAAFRSNSRITNVWMVCANEGIAQRVRAGAVRAFNGDKLSAAAYVTVIVAETHYGYWHMPRFYPEDNPAGEWDENIAASITKLLNPPPPPALYS